MPVWPKIHPEPIAIEFRARQNAAKYPLRHPVTLSALYSPIDPAIEQFRRVSRFYQKTDSDDRELGIHIGVNTRRFVGSILNIHETVDDESLATYTLVAIMDPECHYRQLTLTVMVDIANDGRKTRMGTDPRSPWRPTYFLEL